MGRPRKRRLVEESRRAQDLSKAEVSFDDEALSGSAGRADAVVPLYMSEALTAEPTVMSFFEHPASPTSMMDFLDLLPAPYEDALPYLLQDTGRDENGKPDGRSFPMSYGRNPPGGVYFDELEQQEDSLPSDPSKGIDGSLQQRIESLHMPTAISDTFHSTMSEMFDALEPPQSRSSSASSSSAHRLLGMKPSPNISCGCVSSLYHALDSLSRLPQDTKASIRAVRSATKVAWDVVKCRYCFALHTYDLAVAPPIQCFQSMMFLSTLLPSVCNAYAAILERIDAETARAKVGNQTMWFSFHDVGRIWASDVEGSTPGSKVHADNNRQMEPDIWRSKMRAVLCLDIYGFSGDPKAEAPAARGRQGLRGVVALLEERSRKRHDLMDELIAKGRAPKLSPYLMFPQTIKSVPLEQRGCYRILDATRTALDNLVIT